MRVHDLVAGLARDADHASLQRAVERVMDDHAHSRAWQTRQGGSAEVRAQAAVLAAEVNLQLLNMPLTAPDLRLAQLALRAWARQMGLDPNGFL